MTKKYMTLFIPIDDDLYTISALARDKWLTDEYARTYTGLKITYNESTDTINSIIEFVNGMAENRHMIFYYNTGDVEQDSFAMSGSYEGEMISYLNREA